FRSPAHGLDAAGAEDAAARAVDKEAVRVMVVAAANDPGERGGSRAAEWLLAPPSCGVPSGTPRRSSLRLPLSLPGSFASLTTITRTDSLSPGRRRGGAAGSTRRRGSIRPPAWRPRREASGARRDTRAPSRSP